MSPGIVICLLGEGGAKVPLVETHWYGEYSCSKEKGTEVFRAELHNIHSVLSNGLAKQMCGVEK